MYTPPRCHPVLIPRRSDDIRAKNYLGANRCLFDRFHRGPNIRFRAPRLPGSCYTEWKMVDAEGRYFFPNKGSLYMDIQIVDRAG